jgi:hypothetical protein
VQQQHQHRSIERLPLLSPFDEERIVWLKNLEDDIANEDDRDGISQIKMLTQAAESNHF